jgi:MIP family channel proteins
MSNAATGAGYAVQQSAPVTLAREAAAEFLGTFVLMVFGIGVVAQVVLSGGSAGGILSIHIAWGLAVTMGVYTAGGVSGAHLNPAVTLALAVRGRCEWRKVPAFILAQFTGSFAASAVVYLTYREALQAFDGGARQITGAHATAGIWSTYPQNFLTTFPGGFIDQLVGTALLLLLISALTDEQNFAPPGRFAPPMIGAGVTLIGGCFGFNAGYAINPARDLAPRLFTAMMGWGPAVFSAGNYWWWVPVVAPCIGAIVGLYAYDFLIRGRMNTISSGARP